ncbi:MAG: SurA N-terminal domain-containing protein [Hyphomicrobiaceae bacterium]
MLDSMRRGAQGWVGKILLGFLAICFGVFWSISDAFRGFGEGSLARVGNVEISTNEFQQSYQTQFENLRRRFGGRITAEQARAFGFDQQVLSQLVGAAAIDNHAMDLQLGLSEEAITDHLKRDPRFVGADGKFNKLALDGFIKQNGLTERGFLNIARKDEVRDQLTIAMVESVNVPKAMVEVLHKFREETRKISFFTLDPAKVPAVGEPDDAKLTATYEANKRRFMTPELRTAAALLLTGEQVKKSIAVSDEDLKSTYDQNPERFNVAEKRRIQQIAFTDKVKAEAAAKAIAGGKSFADVAKEAGAKDGDMDLGLVTQKSLIDQKIAEAAFKLAKDAVSPVVEGRFTNVLLKVTEIQAGKLKALAEVKDELKESIAAERASAEIQKQHDAVEDARSSGKSLKEVAAALKLQLIEIANADRAGKAADGKPAFENAEAERIMNAVFAAKTGVDGEPIELADGGYAWVDLQGTTPEKQREFADVKADVKTLWVETESRKAITAAAQALAERIGKGEAIDKVAAEAGGKVTVTEPTLRGGKPVGLTEQAMNQAFALGLGAAGATDTVDGKSRVVFKVAEIIAAPALTAEQLEKTRAELQRQMQSDTMAGYLAGLQERYTVKINTGALQRATGADRDQPTQ